MLAQCMLNTLEQVTLFSIRAEDSHRRVDDIGDDLDRSISLLDLRQSREAVGGAGVKASVTHGVYQAVLDWSTGLIVKLASALPTLATPVASAVGGGDSTGERHARNARRWLSDPRIWRAFVRALRGGTTVAAEPSTHLPQSASLGVLRAAVFTVRAGTLGAADGVAAGDTDSSSSSSAPPPAADSAADWAFVAILILCGGGIVTTGGAGGERNVGYSSGSMTSINCGVLHELLPRQGDGQAEGEDEAGAGKRKWRSGGAVMRMSLDVYVTFLEEVIRGHIAACCQAPSTSRERRGRRESGGVSAIPETGKGDECDAVPSPAEGVVTELLRFLVVLQAQQTSRRKVFSTFCSKLMGLLFQVLPPEAPTPTAAAARPWPLYSVVSTLVGEALFHEDNLEGYREAFAAAEAAGLSHLAVVAAAEAGEAANTATAAGEAAGRKKRRKKDKVPRQRGHVADGGSSKTPRRVCYQQQLFDEMSALTLCGGDYHPEKKASFLGAIAGAPLVLEGYITRLEKAQHEAIDIHEAAGTAIAPVSGGKRSRSSGGGGGGGTGADAGSSAPSPASQMFRLWVVLTSALSEPLRSVSRTMPPASPSLSPLPTRSALLVPYLRSMNRMLRLIADHDIYRINEDWGGLEFDQLRSFSTSLIRLASEDTATGGSGGGGIINSDDPQPAVATAAMVSTTDENVAAPGCLHEDVGSASAGAARRVGSQDDTKRVSSGAAQEFLKAFTSLLGLNHNVLHDDLRPVLRTTFEWAASAAASAVNIASGGGDFGVDVNSDSRLVLHGLAIGLVVSLVDTYGRLRQMDHLMRALFGAVVDRPSAASTVLRRGECTAALGRAFRRLPEGQIESMWDVFGTHLRQGWSRGRGTHGGELLAREVDAELFVLFVRNLHVTSSVASSLGKLCASLAAESLSSFGAPLEQAVAAATAAVAAPTCSALPSAKERKRSRKRRKSGGSEEGLGQDKNDRLGSTESGGGGDSGCFDHGGGGGGSGVALVEAMMSFRPALEVHGWLLDLDTRCRFWSAVLECSPPPPAKPEQEGGSLPVCQEDGASEVKVASVSPRPSPGDPNAFTAAEDEATALPRIIATAAKAMGLCRGGGGNDGTVSGCGSLADGEKDVEKRAAAGARRKRLERTLQQVAVHRVQQIYARLNGVAALQATAVETYNGEEEEEGEEEKKRGGNRAPAAAKAENARFKEEARGLVAFACEMCGGGGGTDFVRWGDEHRDDGGDGGASWSMMLPYLPVWVDFATREQVALFLEALLSRCASDVLARRGEKESMPLRLLSDASFYEMGAVAQSAPAVILAKVFHAVKQAVDGAGGAGCCGSTGTNRPPAPETPPGAVSSMDVIVAAIQDCRSAEVQESSRREQEISNSGGSKEVKWTGGATMGSDGSKRRGEDGMNNETREQRCGLLEASCLVIITERFPPGFLDEEALAGLLVAVDALDAVLTRTLSSEDGGCSGSGWVQSGDGDAKDAPALVESAASGNCMFSVATNRRARLVGALSALRGFALKLARTVPPDSRRLDRLPHGDTLLRVAGAGSGLSCGAQQLLRASVRLLPYLAERCVVYGDTKMVLQAIARLNLAPQALPWSSSNKAASGAAEKRRRRQRRHLQVSSSSQSSPQNEIGRPEEDEEGGMGGYDQLFLLHGLLSGFVAGERRRLAEDNTAAANTVATDQTMASDSDDGGRGGHDWPSAFLDQGLVATVSHLVDCLPTPAMASPKPVTVDSGVSSSLLFVWSDALRMSFLGADAERLVFADSNPGGKGRSRSRWVEDCVVYLADHAESSTAAAAAADASGAARNGGFLGSMPGERSAFCHLVRAVCGCSHLLDPPLPPRSVRRLVEAFITIAASTPFIEGAVEGGFVDSGGAAHRRQLLEEDVLLHTSFCLLVQHGSEAQLGEIITTLLEILGEKGMVASAGLAPMLPKPRSKSTRDYSTAVKFVRLAARAGRGAPFRAVLPKHALSLAAALCRQLREAASADERGGGRGHRNSSSVDDDGGKKNDGGRDRRENQGLCDATEALEALEGLLDRQPYSSVNARVVSVIFGAMELAVGAAFEATLATRAPNAGSSGDIIGSSVGFSAVGESLRCFHACCRVLGTVLQHYARKVYSCTPPFASLCRSLLRLYFRLASAPKLTSIGVVNSGNGASLSTSTSAAGSPEEAVAVGGVMRHAETIVDKQVSSSSHHIALSIDDQVAAASVLSRVLEQFVPHKEVLKKYAVFVLLEYVSLSGLTALEPAPKAALLSGIFAVMQACSRREMRQLHGLLGSLPTGVGHDVFRALDEEYQRTHKYVGKM